MSYQSRLRDAQNHLKQALEMAYLAENKTPTKNLMHELFIEIRQAEAIVYNLEGNVYPDARIDDCRRDGGDTTEKDLRG